MSESTAEWLTRIADLLDFLGFWLTTPELFGVKGLRKFDEKATAFLGHIPWDWLGMLFIIVLTSFVWYQALELLGINLFESTLDALIFGFLAGILINRASDLAESVGDRLHHFVGEWVLRNIVLRKPDSCVRRNYLAAGAVCFTISYVLGLLVGE